MQPRSLEEELKHALEELQRYGKASERDATSREGFEQACDTVDMQWSERLERERAAELRGAEITASAVVKKVEQLENQADNDRTLEAIKDLEPIVRDRIWNVTDRDPERSRLSEQEREGQVSEISKPVQRGIDQKFDALQNGMQQAVDAIRENRDPDLSFTLTQQMDKEERRKAFLEKMNAADREQQLEQEHTY